MQKKLQFVFTNSQLFTRFLFSLSLLILTSFSVYGEGTVKGVVTAADDDSPLLAATVAVDGTTKGVITNFNGEYLLALKAGTYTLRFSYIGYETKEEVVTIENNKVLELNVGLGSTAIMGKEVVVTSQARGQLSAVNQQVRSNQIINVVSADRIRELPDENAAQAISRLPGINLDGSKVVIRGVESKMNKILINGIEMPSTEGNSRSTDLGMVSANMLSGIEVFKTLTPDMDADAVGGVVNLRLREASSGFHYTLTAQGTYIHQEQTGSYKIWGDLSNRFLNNKLGVLLNVNYESYKGGTDWITPRYMEFGSNEIGEAKYKFRDLNVYDQLKETDNLGGSVIIDYVLPNGKLVYSGMLSHSANEETVDRNYLDADTRHHQIILDHSKNNRLLLNNSLLLEQQLGIVKLDASIANVSINWADEFNYSAPAKEVKDPYTINNSGILSTDDYRESMEPWAIYSFLDTSTLETFRLIDAQLTPTTYNEEQWVANLNLQIPLRISDNININFRLGGKYKSMNRDYNKDVYSYSYETYVDVNKTILPWLNSIGQTTPNDNIHFDLVRDYNYKANKEYLNNSPHYKIHYTLDRDLMDQFMLEQLKPEVLFTGSDLDEDDYWGGEKLYAGYMMGEINLGKKLVIIPGVRYELVKNEYYAPKVETVSKTIWNTIDTLSGTAQHANLLPHLHMRFRATDWWDIRFSYNNTLARPDYNHALPNISYNTSSGGGTAGNPRIRPAVSENIDANFTFYSRKLGLVTIGGYYKIIHDVFYMQPTFIKNIPDSAILAEFDLARNREMSSFLTDFYTNSPYDAYVKGLELEWQSNFSWLPAPFNGIVLNANYTRIWSETEYMQNRVFNEYTWTINANGDSVRSRIKLPVERDTTYMNRLLNQANDLANVSVGYDYKGFSARISFRFQGNVMSRIGVRLDENEFTDNVYSYDLVVKQKIPIKSANFEVFFNAINITNAPFKRYAIYSNKGKTNTYTRYSGALLQLGLRLRY